MIDCGGNVTTLGRSSWANCRMGTGPGSIKSPTASRGPGRAIGIPGSRIIWFQADGETRPRLLEELLRIEREIRSKAGEVPDADEFHRAFPEDRAVVEAVCGSPRPHGAGRSSKPAADADRNLLFGILALQMDFVGATHWSRR